ncbi:hypothetical protein O1611_g4039 [Lasiodiplodia mahajangana]|uniref:Uncharacterized protein n=1 Tax=Lasiodiplodia mahajangana TaxID=1108764 RepID=A0ACC2JQ16_9PEZI|nr:hypothetical protein O1611_g4039 [Lasiodiplodia mahajangana]
MPSIQMLLLCLAVSGIAFSHGSEFVEFLSPQENEEIAANSVYLVKWAACASAGRGTMNLLAGETSASLNELWEIAYSIDIVNGTFSWPVGLPAPGSRPSNFYSLNFSQDGNEGVFTISPPFRILPDDGRVPPDGNTGNISGHPEEGIDRRDTNGGDSGGGGGGGSNGDDDSDSRTDRITSTPATKPISKTSKSSEPTIKKSSSELSSSNTTPEPTQNSSSGGPLSSNTTPETNLSNSTGMPSSSSTTPASPSPNSASTRRLSASEIAGIVIGSVVALAIFGNLIWLVMYYRRKSLGKNKPANPEDNRISEIDGRFKKAELDAEGPEIRVPRVYELDATREIQETDGRMKPVELDSTPVTPGLADVEAKRDKAGTDDLGESASKSIKGEIVTNWAFY